MKKIPVICFAVLMLTACGNTSGDGVAAFTRDMSDTSAPAETVTETEAVTVSPTETVTTTAAETAITAAETTATTAETTTATAAPEPAPAGEIDYPYCTAYALYNADTGEYIAEKGLDERISIASTTKLLTASLALRYLDPEDVITVGEEVRRAQPDSTLSYLLPYTEISVYDLLAGMLLPSGNDAAYTVAVNTARAAAGNESLSDDEAVAYFVELMNGFGAELGMENSRFANPEGWDDPGHYSTLRDMIKLAGYAAADPTLREITSTYQREFYSDVSGDLWWTNTNLFLDPYSAYYREDCTGIKTGTTSDAGCCLIAKFNIDGTDYICAVMGCEENEQRYELVNEILAAYLP